jgi:anti-sigma factor RsiW
MTCREASNLLPLFLDGELDPRQMRAVAMHSMRCETCEAELKGMERVQLLVSETIKKRVDEIDFGDLWSGIERRIVDVRVPLATRVRAWWEGLQIDFDLRIPALVAAAAVAALAFTWYARQDSIQLIDAQQVATADDQAVSEAAIESLETTFDNVDFFNDTASNATVMWVSDEGPLREPMP